MKLTSDEITDIVQGKSGDWKKVGVGVFQHIPTKKHYGLVDSKLIEIQAIAPTIWAPITIADKIIDCWCN